MLLVSLEYHMVVPKAVLTWHTHGRGLCGGVKSSPWAQGSDRVEREKVWYQLMKGDNGEDKKTPLNLWTSHTLYLTSS